MVTGWEFVSWLEIQKNNPNSLIVSSFSILRSQFLFIYRILALRRLSYLMLSARFMQPLTGMKQILTMCSFASILEQEYILGRCGFSRFLFTRQIVILRVIHQFLIACSSFTLGQQKLVVHVACLLRCCELIACHF